MNKTTLSKDQDRDHKLKAKTTMGFDMVLEDRSSVRCGSRLFHRRDAELDETQAVNTEVVKEYEDSLVLVI